METCIIIKHLKNTNLQFSKRYGTVINFVPNHRPVKLSDVDCFTHFIEKYRRILVLTGAGISTESGIPDYRSEGVGLYARSNHKPMQYQEFLKSSYARKRYWARNFIAWPKMTTVEPNISHMALAQLGNKVQIVTQNVDGLHSLAGSKDIIELHGTLRKVVCLSCGHVTPRTDVQDRLLAKNSNIEFDIGLMRPDGDVDINDDLVNEFQLVDCERCGGILKPDIVFFGDNVPAERVKRVATWVEECDSLLVVASSLTVFSAYRILLQAKDLGKYIFIVNIGETRGDKLANIKLSVRCSDLLKNVGNKNNSL